MWVRVVILWRLQRVCFSVFLGKERIPNDACKFCYVFFTFFLLSNITFFLFSLLSLSTHYSDFLGVVVLPLPLVPIFMGVVPFIPKIKPRWFSFFTLIFINHNVCCGHSANTHSVSFWLCVGGFNSITFWPLVVGLVPLLA